MAKVFGTVLIKEFQDLDQTSYSENIKRVFLYMDVSGIDMKVVN